MVRLALLYADQVIALLPGEFVIGRSPSCDLTIDDRMVSRRHLVLRVADGSVMVEDSKSRNGASVNGSRLQGPTTLVEGDLIKIGRHELRLTTFEARDRARKPTAMSVTRRVRAQRNSPPPDPGSHTMTVATVEAALSAGDYEDAEAALARILDWLRPGNGGHVPQRDMLASLTKATISFGDNTRRWQPMTAALELYHAIGCPPPRDIVDTLEARVDALPMAAVQAVRSLAIVLAQAAEQLPPDQHADMERLMRMSEPPEEPDDPTLIS